MSNFFAVMEGNQVYLLQNCSQCQVQLSVTSDFYSSNKSNILRWKLLRRLGTLRNSDVYSWPHLQNVIKIPLISSLRATSWLQIHHPADIWLMSSLISLYFVSWISYKMWLLYKAAY